jgi:hypothetical protein
MQTLRAVPMRATGMKLDRAQYFRDLSLPFYGYNRPGAPVADGVRDSCWRQGMLAGIKGAYDCIKVFSETSFVYIQLTRQYLNGYSEQAIRRCVGARTVVCCWEHAARAIQPPVPTEVA